METSLDLVQVHCGPEFQAFQRCLWDASDPTVCQSEKKQLNQCTDMKVPMVRRIRERCRSPLKHLESCVASCEDHPELCIDHLRAFYTCSSEGEAAPAAHTPQ